LAQQAQALRLDSHRLSSGESASKVSQQPQKSDTFDLRQLVGEHNGFWAPAGSLHAVGLRALVKGSDARRQDLLAESLCYLAIVLERWSISLETDEERVARREEVKVPDEMRSYSVM
jgi:hypothetical protein